MHSCGISLTMIFSSIFDTVVNSSYGSSLSTSARLHLHHNYAFRTSSNLLSRSLVERVSFASRHKIEMRSGSPVPPNSQLHTNKSRGGSPCNHRVYGFKGDSDRILPLIHRLNKKIYYQPRAASGGDMPSGAKVERLNSIASSLERVGITDSPFFSFLLSERAKLVALVAFAMALCNADRVVMSVAVVPLASAHNWSSSLAGIVQSSFLWGYLMSPVAGGALADYCGGKLVLAGGMALWSLATLLTPWAANHSFGMLLGIRVLMGIGEGVALPCMNNMISRWFPLSERATAVGLSMAGFHLGSVIGLLSTPLIIARSGLSGPFNAFGLLGFLWLLLWILFIPDNPESCKRMSKSELSLIKKGNEGSASLNVATPATKNSVKLPPLGLLLSKPPTWAIIVANSMHCWGYFILLSWMPIYFNTVFGIKLKEASWFSALPWAMMAAVGFAAGMLSDVLIKSGLTVTSVRKMMQTIGFLGPAIALFGLNAADNASVGAIWLTVAVGLSSFSQAGFLINYQEVGPRYAGVLHGISNTAATIAGIIGTIATGYCVQWLGSFQAFLSLTAIMYIACTLFWNTYATGEKIFD